MYITYPYSNMYFGKSNSFFEIDLYIFLQIRQKSGDKEGEGMRYETGAAELILSAGRQARALGHSYVGSIHFLLALAEEPGITGQTLRFAGVDA